MNIVTMDFESKKVVIIGAGPAGLTAASELCKVGVELSLIHI